MWTGTAGWGLEAAHAAPSVPVASLAPAARPAKSPSSGRGAIGAKSVVPPRTGPTRASGAATSGKGGSLDTAPGGRGNEGVETPDGATLTIWGMVGGRKWGVCAELAARAERDLVSFSDDARTLQAEHPWIRRAESCPHSAPILESGARTELTHLPRFAADYGGMEKLSEGIEVAKVEKELVESRERALAWLDEAAKERARRGEAPPFELAYWRARALIALARFDEAREALDEAWAAKQSSRAKLERLDALLSLYRGDSERALQMAHRALHDGARENTADAALVYALVLDRAGDPEGASRMMLFAARYGSKARGSLDRLQTMVPMYERLYLIALNRALADGMDARLAIQSFQAYLACPEPLEPERRLAERHVERLRSKPGRLGG